MSASIDVSAGVNHRPNLRIAEALRTKALSEAAVSAAVIRRIG